MTEWERWSKESIRGWVDQQEHIYYFEIPPLNRQINRHVIEKNFAIESIVQINYGIRQEKHTNIRRKMT